MIQSSKKKKAQKNLKKSPSSWNVEMIPKKFIMKNVRPFKVDLSRHLGGRKKVFSQRKVKILLFLLKQVY